jgi:dTDP-4-dehydrorhamnose reductase
MVLHLAGETDLDHCELKPKQAFKDNVKLTYEIARTCRNLGIPIIYLSSDAAADPCSEYGWQKRASEAILLNLPNNRIVRVGWVYGDTWGFPQAVLNMLEKYGTVMAPRTELGAPVYIDDLLIHLLKVVTTPFETWKSMSTIEEIGCMPIVSRYELAQRVVRQVTGMHVGVVTAGLDPKYIAKRPEQGILAGNLRDWQPTFNDWCEVKRKAPGTPGAEAAGQAGEVPSDTEG